jgi:branched-chain amino acid aminotransferase
VFVVRGRHLRTPRHDILAGITRETVFEIASERGLGTEETDLELYDAYTADEIFICGTAGGLLPITSIDGRQIGSGRPGPVFEELHAAYQSLIASDRHGTPVFS